MALMLWFCGADKTNVTWPLDLSENKGDNQSEQENRSEDEAKASQESQSLSLRFLSSSDESDLDDGKSNKKQEETSNKRSRSPANSDLESGEGQMKKKQRLYDSDDEADKQKSAATEKEGSFPATLYTQGPDSDSELDDHVPLRKVIQKKKFDRK